MVTKTQRLTAGGSLIVKVPHQIKALLTEKASKWMTSDRLLQYETYLMDQEDLELSNGKGFNLASCLTGPEGGGLEEIHYCIQVVDLQTRAREELQDTPGSNGENVSIDGSSRMVEGKPAAGYAVIKGRELLEGGSYPPHGQYRQ